MSMGFPRQEYWSGLPFSSSGDFSNSGFEPGCPALMADSLPSEPPEKPLIVVYDPFHVLLDSVCEYFVEYICMYVCQ